MSSTYFSHERSSEVYITIAADHIEALGGTVVNFARNMNSWVVFYKVPDGITGEKIWEKLHDSNPYKNDAIPK